AAAVGAAPGDAALGVEALEVADEEHAEVDAGGNAGAADAVGVVGAAEILHEGVKAGLAEEGGQVRIEGEAGGDGQVGGRDPQVGLLGLASTEGHEDLAATGVSRG